MRKVGLFLLVAFSSIAVWADNYSVSVQANGNYCTNGIYGCTVGDVNYPSSNESSSMTGSQSASAMVSDGGTTSSRTNPAGTSSSFFSSVSATEGHVGLSFNAYAEGIGFSGASGSASWNDVMTVGGVPLGQSVNLTATVGITAEFVGLGWGNTSVQACFSGSIFSNFCTSGGDDQNGSLTIPAMVTQEFQAYGGEQIQLSGTANGSAYANNWDNAYDTGSSIYSSSSDWSMVATNSAHFSITATDPNVTLTLASGCDITNGYGCDAPPTSSVPEPSSSTLLAVSLVGLAGLVRRRVAR